MNESAIKSIRLALASKWRWIVVCWRLRPDVSDLIEHFDKVSGRVKALESAQSSSHVELVTAREEAEEMAKASRLEWQQAATENDRLKGQLAEAVALAGRTQLEIKTDTMRDIERRLQLAEQAKFDAAVKAEVLQHELDDLRTAHSKERGGNMALRKFIELNHKPTVIRK